MTAPDRRDTRRPELSLYSATGARKYINTDERRRFLDAAMGQDTHTRVLCLLLLHTGCRLSEALSLTLQSIQGTASVVAIRSLKKRGRIAVREVPVPGVLIEELRELAACNTQTPDTPLWTWHRTWAWTRIKAVMAQAGIVGLHASPKGLRHGFGVHAVHSGVPLNLVQKWLGHAKLSTTAIYTNAVGPEEFRIAERMWGDIPDSRVVQKLSGQRRAA